MLINNYQKYVYLNDVVDKEHYQRCIRNVYTALLFPKYKYVHQSVSNYSMQNYSKIHIKTRPKLTWVKEDDELQTNII